MVVNVAVVVGSLSAPLILSSTDFQELRLRRGSEARLQLHSSVAAASFGHVLRRFLQLGFPGGLMLGFESWSFELQAQSK